MKLKYTLTNESVSIVDLDNGGKTTIVRKDSVNFKPLVDALISEDETRARGFFTVAKTIETWTDGAFKMAGNSIQCGDETLPASLGERIVKMIKAGDDPKSLLNFWNRLTQNPSWSSVNQVWGFLANAGIPIDQDGYILAYKAVNNNWTDCHTGTLDNSVGATQSVDRRKVSDDPNTPCHFGLHVGALFYATSFGPHDRRMIICKVDPKDVVCVPHDSSQQKVRCCHYEVIGVHNGAKMSDTTHNTKADPAVASAKKAGKEATKTAKTAPEKVKKGTRADKHDFDDMDTLTLMEQPLGELRTYAAVNLKIIGASKIPGGKVALVERIEEVRS